MADVEALLIEIERAVSINSTSEEVRRKIFPMPGPSANKFPLIQLPRKSEASQKRLSDSFFRQFPLIQLPRKSEEKNNNRKARIAEYSFH